MSIVFDRAVTYYDQTRSLAPDRHQTMIDALVQATGITPDSRVLEIGIGTGRIAVSIAEHVHRLFGIDLSLEMMGVLRGKLAGTSLNVSLSQANALELPFAETTFDTVYAVHVYHLVRHWQDALKDARRVLKPGGFFVLSFHIRRGETPNRKLRQKLAELVQEYGLSTKRPGAQNEDEIYAELETWGDPLHVVVADAWQENEVPAEILDALDRQIYSETWAIPRNVMDEITPRLRAWAEQEFGDLSQPFITDQESRWLVLQKSK